MKYLRKIAAPAAARHDQGWTFIEATFSVVLLTVVFLGFTVSLMSVREWMERRWSIRLMDQYANDILTKADSLMRESATMWKNSNRNGLGSFSMSLYRFSQYPVLLQDSVVYTFTAHPNNGVMLARGPAASRPFDPDFPSPYWRSTFTKDNKFKIINFGFTPSDDPTKPQYFNQAFGEIYLKIRYQRPRTFYSYVDPRNEVYVYDKRYAVSVFMKNRINRPSSE